MKKTLLGTSIVALVHAMSAVPALADDTINHLLTNAQLVEFCNTAGIGSEKPAQIRLSDGTTAAGAISCDAGSVNTAAGGDPNALVGDDGSVEDSQGDNSDAGDEGDAGDGGDSGDSGDNSDAGDAGDASDGGDGGDNGANGDD